MPQITGLHAFYLFMGTAGSVFILIPCVVIMQFLMPRAVLDCYWKEPHFRPVELALFEGVLAPIRTLMFIWAIVFPRLGKKRKLTPVREMVPGWYRMLAWCIALWILGAALVMSTIIIGTFAYAYLNGMPILSR